MPGVDKSINFDVLHKSYLSLNHREVRDYVKFRKQTIKQKIEATLNSKTKKKIEATSSSECRLSRRRSRRRADYQEEDRSYVKFRE